MPNEFSSQSSGYKFFINVKHTTETSYLSINQTTVEYINDYSKEYFELYNLINDQVNNDNLSKLTQELASDDIREAKEASKQVIDDTLDGFTGSGSAAAKGSDIAGMKSISGDVQSGLNGGGSISGATYVFGINSGFWDWFTQTTSNNINNPYPAPIVDQTRGSGDEIIDFLTNNNQEVQDLLRSREGR